MTKPMITFWRPEAARPVLYPGATFAPVEPIDARTDRSICFRGKIPVMTVSLHDLWNYLEFDYRATAMLCREKVLLHIGDPDESLNCYVDAESTARAYVVWTRAMRLGAQYMECIKLAADIRAGGVGMDNTLSEFMRGLCFSYAHHGDITGHHEPPPTYEYTETFPTYHALYKLRAYAAAGGKENLCSSDWCKGKMNMGEK